MRSLFYPLLLLTILACSRRSQDYIPRDSSPNRQQSVLVMTDSAKNLTHEDVWVNRVQDVSDGLGPDVLFLNDVEDSRSLMELVAEELPQFQYARFDGKLVVLSRYPLTLEDAGPEDSVDGRRLTIRLNSEKELRTLYLPDSYPHLSVAANARFLRILRLKPPQNGASRGIDRPFVAEILVP